MIKSFEQELKEERAESAKLRADNERLVALVVDWLATYEEPTIRNNWVLQGSLAKRTRSALQEELNK